QNRYAGSTDIPLNNIGIEQAGRAAEKLKALHFDAVVSSSLMRARQTSEIICTVLGMDFTVEKLFAERNVGVYEGLTREEAKLKYPDMFNRNCTRLYDDAPDGGETIRQFEERITLGLKKLKADYKNKTVLLVCHGFVSRMINKICNNLSFDEMHTFLLDNCEYIKYEI
ncbi:histidine phosphatase family protein, partial [Eubacteriales bacterium OttesenSCG-928-G02]|nr:histidine phosphatase family protein [Eubacteriales bacterium OttesenSCG-928-G02]